jgi:hypothetical protein
MEDFFNEDFWRQLVAVLVGAFFGFGGALATAGILGRGRRQTLARMTRQIIVSEAIDNLRALRQIDKLSHEMREEGFDSVRTSTLRARAAILQQFMTAESLAALSERERMSLAVVTPQLAYLSERYDDYEGVLASPLTAVQKVKTETGAVVPRRDWATDRLLADVALVGTNVLDMLIQACRQAKGQLADDRSKEIGSKLAVLTFGDAANFWRAFKTSLTQASEDLDARKWLVVWEHDWPECPMPVIELRSPSD